MDDANRSAGATCPACKREYRRAIPLTADTVIRGHLSGDVCLTADYLVAHGDVVVEAPDDEFPTRTVGAMGNRREEPVAPTEVSGVEADVFVFPDA
jgi:hypothetical protein